MAAVPRTRLREVGGKAIWKDWLVNLHSMHIHRTQERRFGVGYCIGGHRALTDVSPASQAMNYSTRLRNCPTMRGAKSGQIIK